MSNYLTVARFKLLTVMADEDVDALEARFPGFLMARSEVISGTIDARLRKRYAAPFESPYPNAVELWVARILTPAAYLKRGVDTTDRQFTEVYEDSKAAWVEIKEAANAVEGLYDLPLRQDTTATGISKGGPLGYSEASPYTWTDEQWEAAQDE